MQHSNTNPPDSILRKDPHLLNPQTVAREYPHQCMIATDVSGAASLHRILYNFDQSTRKYLLLTLKMSLI